MIVTRAKHEYRPGEKAWVVGFDKSMSRVPVQVTVREVVISVTDDYDMPWIEYIVDMDTKDCGRGTYLEKKFISSEDRVIPQYSARLFEIELNKTRDRCREAIEYDPFKKTIK